MQGKLLIVFEDALAPDLVQIVRRAAQPDRLSNRGRACFKAMRRRFKFALRQRDTGDHFATAMKGLHRLEDFLASIKHPCAGGAAHLVARKRQEIAVDLADVERPVARALRGIDERDRSHRPSPRTKVGDRIDCPESVRDMGEGENFHRPIEQGVELLEIKSAFGRDGDEAQHRSLAAREKLPWHQIAMVFHLGKEDDIALANVGVAPGASHQVNAFGGSSCENDGFRRRSEVAGQSVARAFEGGRRPIAQFMQSSMDIAVIVLVKARQ